MLKNGYTLAEVLIVICILFVVVTLILPTLINTTVPQEINNPKKIKELQKLEYHSQYDYDYDFRAVNNG